MKNKTIDLKSKEDLKKRYAKKRFRKCPKCGQTAINSGWMSQGDIDKFHKRYTCQKCDFVFTVSP
jgi:transposase-like protein